MRKSGFRMPPLCAMAALLAGCGEEDEYLVSPAGSGWPVDTIQVRVFDAVTGPIANAGVDMFVGNGYSYTWASGGIPPVTDADGRLTAEIGSGSSLIVTGVRKSGYVKPCVARAQGASLEVEVVAESTLNSLDPPAPLSAAGTVTMSGTVFEMTDAGRRPIAGARVTFEDIDGIVFATTISDLGGHYLICNLQGELPTLGGIEMWFQKAGFTDVTVAPVNRAQSTVVDIEMKRSP